MSATVSPCAPRRLRWHPPTHKGGWPMSKPWRLQAASFSRTEAFQGMIRSDPAAAAVKSFMRRNMRQSAQSLFTVRRRRTGRSEEHTSELQSLMRISYAVFCLKKKKIKTYRLQMTRHNMKLKK